MHPIFPLHTASVRCEHCGARVEEGDAYCDAPLCQTKSRVIAAQKAGSAVKAANEREQRLAKRRTTKLMRTVARRAGAKDLGKIAYAVVPHVLGETKPRTTDQERPFLMHLDAVIAEAFAAPPKEPRVFSHEETPDSDFANWENAAKDDPISLVASCIACQGDCCYRGNIMHAFLTPNTIAWVRHRSPSITQDEVRAAYVDMMPPESVPGSCVFHGPEGCTLQRDMRADICNRWQCSYRRNLEQQIARKGATRSVVAGLPRDHDKHPGVGETSVKMVSTDETNGVQVHEDLVLPALRGSRKKP